MGCCISVSTLEDDSREVSGRQQVQEQNQQQTLNNQSRSALSDEQVRSDQEDFKYSEGITKRVSSSFHSFNHSPHPNEKTPTFQDSGLSVKTWPIYVRLSNNSKDIVVQVPTQPPYLTVAELGQELIPSLEKDARVRFIYLGRLLTDQHRIIPIPSTDNPTPSPSNKRSITIQKEGVIQAMITNPL